MLKDSHKFLHFTSKNKKLSINNNSSVFSIYDMSINHSVFNASSEAVLVCIA